MVFGNIFRQRGKNKKRVYSVHPIKEPSSGDSKNAITKLLDTSNHTHSTKPDSLLHDLSVPSTSGDSVLTIGDQPPGGGSYTTILKFKSRKFPSEEQPAGSKISNQANRIEFENPSNHWRLEVYGGVKMWVNVDTSEISVENPDVSDEDTMTVTTHVIKSKPIIINPDGMTSMKAEKNNSLLSNSMKTMGWFDSLKLVSTKGSVKENSSSEEIHYNNPDLKELFDLLDCGKSSRKIHSVVNVQKKKYSLFK